MIVGVGGGMCQEWVMLLNQLKTVSVLLEKVHKQEMDPLRTGFKIL